MPKSIRHAGSKLSRLKTTPVSLHRDCGISVNQVTQHKSGELLVVAVELKDGLHFILHTKLKTLGNCRDYVSPALLSLVYHTCSAVKSKNMENFTKF